MTQRNRSNASKQTRNRTLNPQPRFAPLRNDQRQFFVPLPVGVARFIAVAAVVYDGVSCVARQTFHHAFVRTAVSKIKGSTATPSVAVANAGTGEHYYRVGAPAERL